MAGPQAEWTGSWLQKAGRSSNEGNYEDISHQSGMALDVPLPVALSTSLRSALGSIAPQMLD